MLRLQADDIATVNDSMTETHLRLVTLVEQQHEILGKDFNELTLRDSVEAAGRLGGVFEGLTKLVAEMMWRDFAEKELAEKGEAATVEGALERLNQAISRRTIQADHIPNLNMGLHGMVVFAAYQSAVLAHMGHILAACNEALVIFGAMCETAGKYGVDPEALRRGDPDAVAGFKKASVLDAGFTFDDQGRVVGMHPAQAQALGLTVAPEAQQDNEELPDDVSQALGG